MHAVSQAKPTAAAATAAAAPSSIYDVIMGIITAIVCPAVRPDSLTCIYPNLAFNCKSIAHKISSFLEEFARRHAKPDWAKVCVCMCVWPSAAVAAAALVRLLL